MARQRARFIAGATCPQCKSIDTLKLFMQNNVETIECVKCGHQKTQADDNVQAATRGSESVIGVFKPD